MPSDLSPGVTVTITDESMYASSGQGNAPLIVIATQSNKASPSVAGAIAAETVAKRAGKLFLATSQRELIQNFGNPYFQVVEGTPVHGAEVNEYGLWAAYSYLGIEKEAYVLRADIDTHQLLPSVSAPRGAPVAGTYWFDLTTTKFGMFRANGSTSPGNAWVSVTVKVPPVSYVNQTTGVPYNSFGVNGDICVVPWTLSNYFYEKVAGAWVLVGSDAWKAAHPTIVRGTAVNPTMIVNQAFVINGVQVTVTTTVASNVVNDINSASIPNIVASEAINGTLVISNTVGGDIVIANSGGIRGYPLGLLGITPGTYHGVSVSRTNGPAYPNGSVANSLWVKGNATRNGAAWSLKYYNAGLKQFTVLSTPFYPFDSTLVDGNPAKDTAAIAAIITPAIGRVYVGYDVVTGDQQIRRWNGTAWMGLVYEADFIAPTSPPADGTMWYNVDFAADIMVSDGHNWVAYHQHYPDTDPNGVQIAGSPPETHSDGTTSLAENDLWINTTDLEHYPALYRWSVTDLQWLPVDNTDQSSPLGVVFADARENSGPVFTGHTGSYQYNSIFPVDLAKSSYVDPDAPDPRTYPNGMLLFNTRFSTYNVKQWKPNYFKLGNFDPNTDFTNTPYNIGDPTNISFSAVANAGRWVTVSGNRVDGSPYMGRKAVRAMIVRALAKVITENQDIRSELVYFNLMAVPGYPELASELVTLNTDIKNIAFGIIDTPARLIPQGSAIQNFAKNANNVEADGEDGLVTNNPYLGIYYPWGLGINTDGNEVMIPPSAIALRTFAYSDKVSYPWLAPAGLNRGLVTNATSVGYLSSEGEYNPVILNEGLRNVLYQNKINPIPYLPGRGLVIYGEKTLSPIASALDRINVARLCNYISYNLDHITQPLLFEPQVRHTRTTAKAIVERFLNSLVGLDGLYDYLVVCDNTNNTPDRIDRNELWIDVFIQPVKTIEFIIIPVRVQTTQIVG